MRTLRFTPVLMLAALMLTVSGCDSKLFRDTSAPAVPKTGSLTQRLSMMDAEGRNFGTVEIDPVNGGKVMDAQGRLVGYIVPPARAGVAPVAEPVAPQPVYAPQAPQPQPAYAPQPQQGYAPQQPIYAPQPLR